MACTQTGEPPLAFYVHRSRRDVVTLYIYERKSCTRARSKSPPLMSCLLRKEPKETTCSVDCGIIRYLGLCVLVSLGGEARARKQENKRNANLLQAALGTVVDSKLKVICSCVLVTPVIV